MRVLLIAYEFPPIIAAQSLRWFYLANGLATLGVEVHVLCPNMPALPPFQEGLAPGVIIHRAWPGPYVGFSQSVYLRLAKRPQGAGSAGPAGAQSIWLKMHRWGRRLLDQILFPDLRTEWAPFASLRLIQLLRTTPYSAIVASHEPGVDLLLGLLAKKITRAPLIVDLADPVVTPYTPRWRRRLDLAFEAKILAKADTAVVTTEAAIDLLKNRHDLQDAEDKFTCVAQGFPDESKKHCCHNGPRSEAFHLVYTGNFYADFRSPAEFASALRSISDLNITVSLYGNHAEYRSLFDGIPGISFFGTVDHCTCLSAQQNCNALLSIGNKQPFQVPGKIYEYLGVGVPILHLAYSAADEAGRLIAQLGAGLAVLNRSEAIESALRDIHARWSEGTLQSMFSRDEEAIAEFSWSKRASRYKEVIERSIKTSAASRPILSNGTKKRR